MNKITFNYLYRDGSNYKSWEDEFRKETTGQ